MRLIVIIDVLLILSMDVSLSHAMVLVVPSPPLPSLPAQHKARNLLKRVGKMEVSGHDGEDFEKANLLLAKFYIDKVPSYVLRLYACIILTHDSGCCKPYQSCVSGYPIIPLPINSSVAEPRGSSFLI